MAGNANWSTQFFGTTNDYLIARDWPLASGRLFEPAELAGSGKVALIGQTTARQLFGEGVDPVDQVIRVRKVPLVVIGVLERKGQNALGQDQDDIILMPISTARNRVRADSAHGAYGSSASTVPWTAESIASTCRAAVPGSSASSAACADSSDRCRSTSTDSGSIA